jgi:hypothetical protein
MKRGDLSWSSLGFWWPYVTVIALMGTLVGGMTTLWNWNNTTVKDLLGLVAWLCFTLVCLVLWVGHEIIVAVTPRCQHCGAELTVKPASLIHDDGCPNRISEQ